MSQLAHKKKNFKSDRNANLDNEWAAEHAGGSYEIRFTILQFQRNFLLAHNKCGPKIWFEMLSSLKNGPVSLWTKTIKQPACLPTMTVTVTVILFNLKIQFVIWLIASEAAARCDSNLFPSWCLFAFAKSFSHLTDATSSIWKHVWLPPLQ